ncbi:MAG: hypothetical protein FJY92_08910 [Candidatus Hydrogenedentes bacterium]|nr:hypothetical protein [Candidatus Hydrogenedentota bacterium]
MSEFGDIVQAHFRFLIEDYPFALTSGDAPVRYDSPPVYIEIWAGSGDTDLLFGAKVDTEIMRPYMPHVFSIAEVVRYYKSGPFPRFDAFPETPGVSGVERYVMYLVMLTKRYCREVLAGDVRALEALSRDRGATKP